MLFTIWSEITSKIPTIGKDGKYRKGAQSGEHIGKIIRTCEQRTFPYVAAAAVFGIGSKLITEKVINKQNQKKKEKQM